MRRSQVNELFTTNYGVLYDGWVLEPTAERELGFYQKYLRGTYKISVQRPVFYLLIRIQDANDKVVYYDYIRTIGQYQYVKKKLKWK